ncbi:heparinase II/III domain-containing protein [Granulicella sibirica]|uniref:heparinase II/III domain-containing protein n=1 Tax=Granulicella sibirica TaxID=2479048 RepID=UPI001008E031|nr:heparinase II/III family protein [Granulicella sibirica]
MCSWCFNARRAAYTFGVTVAALASTAQTQTPHAPWLTSAEYQSHFTPNPGSAADSGSRDGWESFPLAEDAGYDPTLQVHTTPTESALERAASPTQDGPFQLGFIKRLNMVAIAGSSLHLRARTPDVATQVHITIYREREAEHHTAALPSTNWQTLAIPLTSSPEPITAIAVTANFPQGVARRQERFEISDVDLKASGLAHLPLAQPEALWDEARAIYYLRRSIAPNEDVHLTFARAADAKWTLTGPGNTIAASGTGTSIAVRPTVSGLWTIHLTTSTTDTTALLLVHSKKALLFDQPQTLTPELLAAVHRRRDELRKLAHPEMGRNISQMDPGFLLPGLASYFVLLTQSPELALLDAIDFRATGDTAALAESRRLIAAIASWPLWVHPWFPAHGYHSYYPVGMMAKNLVVAEQFLGDVLPKEERKALDQALFKQAIQPVYEEYVHEDRLQFNTSNWIGNTVSGALLAALANPDPNAAGYALGLYVKERDHVRAAYTPDGSYGEGASYHRFDLEGSTFAAAAIKRILGTSIDASLLPADTYFRSATYGTAGLLDYGDSHVDLKPSNTWAYLAALNQSPSLTDFYFQNLDRNSPQILPRVLWESAITPTNAPGPAPVSRLFPDRGVAILRDDSTVLSIRAGKNFNHNHNDQGSLFYTHNGTLWLGEAGYSDYYKDPAYSTFVVQAIGHNTILMDHNPESQHLPGNAVFGTAPSIPVSRITPRISLIQIDLTSVYTDLNRYTRTVVFQANGPTVVIDQIDSPAPHNYTQVWHPKQALASLTADSFRLTNASEYLTAQTFSDTTITIERKDDPYPLASYEQAEYELVDRPFRIEISTAAPVTKATTVTILSPIAVKAVWNPVTQTLSLPDATISLAPTISVTTPTQTLP